MVERARLRPPLRIGGAITVLVAFVGGLVWIGGQPLMMIHGESKQKIANMVVHKYADEAIIQWRMQHHEPCPSQLAELNEYMNSKDVKDPWGNPYAMQCDATHIFVSSAGEDGLFGTCDDVGSSDR